MVNSYQQSSEKGNQRQSFKQVLDSAIGNKYCRPQSVCVFRCVCVFVLMILILRKHEQRKNVLSKACTKENEIS